MAPNKPSGSSKPKVASVGATLAKGYRRDDLLLPPHPNANLKQDDDTSTLSDTTHESTHPSPVAAIMDATDNAADDMNDMKPAANKDVEEGEEVEMKREMNEYDEDTDASSDDMEHANLKPAAAVQPPTTLSSFIDSRQNDFSERSWWMVDIDDNSDGNSITQGASPLVKRCMRTYDWSLTTTRKILSAYKQFLMLKKQLEDWDAMLLSPCYLVDMMWHQHILDNVNYYHDMLLLCGHFVGHNPDGGLDIVAKINRDRFTRECLRQTFGSYDTEVWDHATTMDQANNDIDASQNEEEIDIVYLQNEEDFDTVYLDEDEQVDDPINEDQPNNEHDNDANEGGNGDEQNEIMHGNNDANQQHNDDAIDEEENENEDQPNDDNLNQQPNDDINDGNQNQVDVEDAIQHAAQQVAAGNWGGDNGGGGNDGPEKVTIRVKDQTGEETMVRTRRTTHMLRVFYTYARRKGVEIDALRFLLEGEELDGHETADTLGLVDEDQIDCILNQAGC